MADQSAPTRSSGVLMHVTSLPSPFGIGDLGPAAYRWIDTLARAKQTWWQILPLNMPDASNSPYSSHSAFAGNIFLISPELLLRDGLLTRSDLNAARGLRADRVDFAAAKRAKNTMISRATERFAAGAARPLRRAYERFLDEERDWLDDFTVFMAMREQRPDVPWTDWSRPILQRERGAMREVRRELAKQIERHHFAQFLYHRQLAALRAYARDRRVKLMGDVPIYISADSADGWASSHLFQLDARKRPTAVAGVPPDMFSKIGQHWGNPLYDWDAMRDEGYAWWIARVKAALKQADVIRIDHFRGLAGYWRIPASAPTAETGRWVKAPGAEMLDAVRKALGDLPLVAEDLGVITPDVIELRDRFGMAGMQILQFAFGGDDNVALPHNHVKNTIVYTGNHDNDTTLGWWKSLDRDHRERVVTYAPAIAKNPVWGLIRLAMMSVAETVIVPLQDVMSLDSKARMNYPGTVAKETWTWRFEEDELKQDSLDQLAAMTDRYFRTPPPPAKKRSSKSRRKSKR